MNAKEKIEELLEASEDGSITAAQVTEAGLHRSVLQEFVKSGEMYRFGRGLYVRSSAWEDDFYLLQRKYGRGIYSHDTALYLLGYSDRTPAKYTMTFPKHNIEVYLKKLNPESFPTAFSISFNFFNHAKIIGTENIVYIGSANFSNESKQNIETGVIIEDSAFIARLYDEFFEYIKGNSTPYFDDDFNLLRLLTLNLIAKFTVHRAKLSDTLFQRTAYGTYYLPDSPDNVYFSGEDLAELVFDLQSFQDLDVRAENTYSEDNNGYNDDIDEIVARLSEIDVNWLIEIASDDGVLFDFVNFNYEQTWNNCLQEYIAEAYDEYLDEYVERAQNDAIAIYDSKKQDFEDVSDIFIRGIDSIIEVLKLVEELIDRYKDARISADIDNT